MVVAVRNPKRKRGWRAVPLAYAYSFYVRVTIGTAMGQHVFTFPALRGTPFMLELSDGWRLSVDASPEWLFFRITSGESQEGDVPEFAEAVWAIAVEHGIYRLVVEFDHASSLTSALVGQLVVLHKRTHLADGVLRLCGLSEAHCRVFDSMRLTGRLPNYPDREAAVMGYRPRKPR